MLELIRKYSNSIVVKVFLMVLAVTFVFCFGLSSIIRKYTGKDYLVKIGNVKISLPMFNLEKAKKLNMLRNRSKDVDEKAESSSILHQIIWENVIDLATSDFGFIVSDETIKKYISGMYMFRDKDGRFNAEMLRGFLYKIQVPEPTFIEFSRKDIKNGLIKAPFRYISVQGELDHYIKSRLEKRVLSVVELKPDSFFINEKPSAQELETFFSENPDLFMVDETRSFKILEFMESKIEENIKITEDEMKEAYEISPERESRTYEEMKAEIEADLKQEKAQTEINEKTRQIEDSLMAGGNIEEVAKKFGLNLITVSDVTMTNNDTLKVKYKNDVLIVAFSTEDGTDSSFSEAADEKGNKLLWLVHVDSITPKRIAEFAKVQNKIQKEWLRKKQMEKAIEIANSFVEQIKAGERLASLASKNAQTYSVTYSFDRNGDWEGKRQEEANKNDEKAPKKAPRNEKFDKIVSEMYKEAFLNSKKTAFFKEIDGVIVIAQVHEIIPAYAIDPNEREKLHASLIRETVEDLYQQLVGYLSKNRYEVKINHEMLKEGGGFDHQIDDIF
jgi:hypothetical protein